MTVGKLIDELVKLPRGADVILHIADPTYVKVFGWPKHVVWVAERNAVVIAAKTEGITVPKIEIASSELSEHSDNS